MALSRPSWRGLVELASIGAMALGLVVAAAVLLLDDGDGPAAAAPAQSAAERGRVLFQAKGCVGCHRLAGVPAQMEVGPNLSGLAAVVATRRPGVSAEAYVRESIREPGAFFVPGYERGIRMPQLDVTDAELDDLIALLLGPRASAPAEVRRDSGAPTVESEPPPAARLLDRSFAPSPPGAAYPTVWVGDDVTMTLRFGEGSEPVGAVETRFVEDDGHGAMTVAVPAERTAPGIWRASFALTRPGRWEGVHEYRVQTPAGPTLIRSRPFALRVVRPGG